MPEGDGHFMAPTLVLADKAPELQTEVFGPVRARFGWWLESRVAPLVYRRSSYVVVSQATRDELETAALRAGMRSLWDDGMDKVLAGFTSVEELARVVV